MAESKTQTAAATTDKVVATASSARPSRLPATNRPTRNRAEQQQEREAAETEVRAGQDAYWSELLAASEPVEDLAGYPTLAELRRAIATGECRCGGRKVVAVDVPPGHPAYGELFRCSCFVRERTARLQRLFRTAGIPGRFARLDFDTFEALPAEFRQGKSGLLTLARQLADVEACARDGGVKVYYPHLERYETRPGVMFYGSYGVGKTGMAAAVAKAWIDAGMSVLWITYLDFVKAVQSGYGAGGGEVERRIEAARSVDLLVLDDLGRKGRGRQTNDRIDIVDQVVYYRHFERQPTLVTTNLTPEEIGEQFGGRIVERLVYELCHTMSVEGESLRRLANLPDDRM